MQSSSILSLKTDILNQAHLEQVVRDLFPQDNVVSNPRKQSQVTNPRTGHFFEIDIWVPSLQLGFEFQDSYHYMTTWYSHLTLDMVRKKDDNKKDAVNFAGMTLVRVPCWWDGSPGSLLASIDFQRPDLDLQTRVLPISFNPNPGFFPKVELPEIGSLMLASFPLDVHFNHSIEPATWWGGEKYDGVRCCWNPTQKVAYSRTGRKIPLLSSIALSLPKVFVDGEFWFGRGMFSVIYSLIKGGISETSWPSIRMISFDVPHNAFHFLPFELRYCFLVHNVPRDHPLSIVASRILCEGSFHLNALIGKIIDCGGEGMILRRVASRYERGRNPNLIKLKTSYGDKEGLIVSVDASSVSLKLSNGQIFKVPGQSVHISAPAVGEVVTFSYDNLARRDIPVNPEIFRRRPDLRWEDVVSNSQAHHVQDTELRSENFSAQPRGFWTFGNMREFMENFARKLNLDPLLPLTWNKIPFRSIFASKGGRSILRKFRDPFTALTSLFPDIGLHTFGKFRKELRMAWDTPLKRRHFFERYAKENGFDYRSPAAWYAQSRAKILAVKGAANVINYHQRKVSRALMDLFPDIGLERTQFKSWSLHHPIKRRVFFENYAKENGFDPLNPNNWYSQSKLKILSLKGMAVIISHHNNSLAQTLFDLFPEIGFEMSRLMNFSKWNSAKQRREFFVDYAAEHGFDPLVAKHWYTQPKDKILHTKGGAAVMRFHKNSVANALVDLFPDVQFDKSKLMSTYFSSVRKQFFESFAEAHGFAPTDTDQWYMYTTESIMNVEGGSAVLAYHNNQLPQALLDLFPNIGLQKAKFKIQAEWNNRRTFFEKFAKEQGFDPLIARNWYSPLWKDKIFALHDYKRVLYHHKNSLCKAVLDLFPNIGLDKSTLFCMWSLHLPASRRKFFENYAKIQAFDPLVPENWYLQQKEQISALQGCSTVISYHNDQLSQALVDLFPDIGLDRSKLFSRSKWSYLENRRKYFEDYAKESGFDPYVADNWHKQARKSVMSSKGIANVMIFYGNSLSKALTDCFPDIGLQTSKFTWKTRSWNYAKFRRIFFEQFAKRRGFDAHDASHWYQQKIEDILSVEGAKDVLSYHKNSLSHALLALFPDIGFDADILAHRFPKGKRKGLL